MPGRCALIAEQACACVIEKPARLRTSAARPGSLDGCVRTAGCMARPQRALDVELRGRARTRPVCTRGVPAETRSNAERFRGARTSGTRQTQRDLGHAALEPGVLEIGGRARTRLVCCWVLRARQWRATGVKPSERPASPRVRCPRRSAICRSSFAAGVSGSASTSGTPVSAPSRSRTSMGTSPSTGTS